jgi:aminomethyltransferase
MGRLIIKGEEAERFINRMVTNNTSRLEPMSGLYTVMLNNDGGIIDDLIVYKLDDQKFLLVYNASNRDKDYNWFNKHSKRFDASLINVSNEIAMIAIQGPQAEDVLQNIVDKDISKIKRFGLIKVKVSRFDSWLARTGYTGEDGFELFVLDSSLDDPSKALKIWNDLIDGGAVTCGLGARDTLRLEAGLNLYGNELNEDTNPLEARLRWVVKFKKPGGFIGKEALTRIREEGVTRTQVGIKIVGHGIPRKGYDVFNAECIKKIGDVTSGGFSPTLGYGIALGFVKPSFSELGTEVNIRIRQRFAIGKIVKSHPFYDETIYGWKRKK